LKKAVARGEAAGLTPLQLDRVKSALAVQQRKFDARQGLADSVQSCDPDKLRAAIEEGKLAKLMAKESDAAKLTLTQELRKIAARVGLKTAEIFREGGDIPFFRAAIQEGQDAGMEAFELDGPLKLLAMEDMKISARISLRNARENKKGGKLSKEQVLEITQEAVEQGVAAGLTDGELAEARELLVEAKKADARVVLAKAVETRDIAQIKEAIELGKKVGLSEIAFHDARLAIQGEETKHAIIARLSTALAARQIFGLKGAIREGAEVGLAEADLYPLRVALAEEQRKVAAILAIQEGMQMADKHLKAHEKILHDDDVIYALNVVIDEGELAGSDESEIRPARLQVLGMRQQIARDALAEGVKRRVITTLNDAIKKATDVGLAESEIEDARKVLAKEVRKVKALEQLRSACLSRKMPELKKAIREGECVPRAKELSDAKKVLKEETRTFEAHQGLVEAIKSRQIAKLIHWISKAFSAGLGFNKDGSPGGCEDYECAKVVLAEEQRKLAARERLEAAIAQCEGAENEDEHRKSIPVLRLARDEAAEANLPPEEVDKANITLDVELPKVARAGLKNALACRKIKDLKAAIKEAVSVGLPAEELNAPRLALGEEQVRDSVQRKCAFEIRRAVDYGEQFGVDALALEHARQVLVVEDKKDKARELLNEATRPQYQRTTRELLSSRLLNEASDERIAELMAAMSAGRAAGLNEWEFNYANTLVDEERHGVMALSASKDPPERPSFVPGSPSSKYWKQRREMSEFKVVDMMKTGQACAAFFVPEVNSKPWEK